MTEDELTIDQKISMQAEDNEWTKQFVGPRAWELINAVTITLLNRSPEQLTLPERLSLRQALNQLGFVQSDETIARGQAPLKSYEEIMNQGVVELTIPQKKD